MRQKTLFCFGERVVELTELDPARPLEALLPAGGPWELELGFGKGRYLLRRAAEHPERRYLGIEVATQYHRLLLHRARRQGLGNLVAVRGEALYLLATTLPRGFAEVVHVYFPDPWPKSRHHKRRLFDEETVDLVLGALAPGGRLAFATDFLEYGERVVEILKGFPGLEVRRRPEPWPDGARTNYEAKFMREGRPILRLEARLAAVAGHVAAEPEAAGPEALHPRGRAGILAAVAPRRED